MDKIYKIDTNTQENRLGFLYKLNNKILCHTHRACICTCFIVLCRVYKYCIVVNFCFFFLILIIQGFVETNKSVKKTFKVTLTKQERK